MGNLWEKSSWGEQVNLHNKRKSSKSERVSEEGAPELKQEPPTAYNQICMSEKSKDEKHEPSWMMCSLSRWKAKLNCVKLVDNEDVKSKSNNAT